MGYPPSIWLIRAVGLFKKAVAMPKEDSPYCRCPGKGTKPKPNTRLVKNKRFICTDLI